MSRSLTRRTLLVDLGRSVAGLVVVSAGLAACDSSTSTTEPDEGSGGAGDASGPATTAAPGATASGGVGLVDLGFVAAYVVARGGRAAIVDTGVEGSQDAILAVLEEMDLGWGDVGDVIVTHAHGDHAGSLAAVAEAAPEATLHGGEADIPNMTAPRDVMVVADGDTVFDLQVVATPGHTPGHVSVLDPAAGTLFSGDALTGSDGRVAGPDPEFTPDMDSAAASVATLAAFEPSTILVSHGFPIASGAADLTALSEGLSAG